MLRLPALRCGIVTFVLFLVTISAPPVAAKGKDKIVLKNGQGFSVTVLRETYEGVEVDTDADGVEDKTYNPGDVARVEYGDAPKSFRDGLRAFEAGRFAEALDKFEKALPEKDVRWLKQHANYLIGECRRRLGQNDKTHLPKARDAYQRVIREDSKGRLAPPSVKGVGLCLMAEGDIGAAREEFEKLAGYDYGDVWALRGMLLQAGALSRQAKHKEALELCEKVAKDAKDADDARVPNRKELLQEAARTRAAVLFAQGEFDKGYQALMEVIRSAGERDDTIKAQAYNAIGDALLRADRKPEALLAYLRVRVLYFKKTGEELPRALCGAVCCFVKMRESNRAKELVTLLEKDYPSQVWTEKAKQELGG